MYVYYKSTPGRQMNYKVNFKQDELFDLLSYSLSHHVVTNLIVAIVRLHTLL